MKLKPAYRNITISGDISTGKSTLVRNLAAKLAWEHLSGGDFFRDWHKKQGISLNEPDKVPEELDRELDRGFQQKMKVEKNIIFESRLAGWLAKDLADVLSVLCITEEGERMRRAAKRDGESIEKATKDNGLRAKKLQKKWQKLYGVKNALDPRYFDLVVDTTVKNPEEVMEEVLKRLNN
jgi:cytidylate kinase